MLLNNIKFSIRSLQRDKNLVLFNLLGLSIGLCIFILIALFVYNELTVDTYYPKSNRLYRVLENNDNVGIDYNLSNCLATKYPEIEKSCPVYQSSKWEFSLESPTFQFTTKSFISTDNQFFELFDIIPVCSNSSLLLPTDNSLVLTTSTAKKLFGDEEAIGQQLRFMGRSLIVTAIIPVFTKRSSLQADFIVNITNKKNRFLQDYRNGTLVNLHNHYVLVSEGTHIEQLTEKVNQHIASNLNTVSNLSFQPVKSIYLNPSIKLSQNRNGSIITIRLFIAIAIVIFLLSMINNLQFSISYHISNLKSISLRIINGASKRHIYQFYLIDTSVLLLVSLLLSFLLAHLLLPLINPMFSNTLNMANMLKWPLLLLMIFISLTIACFGAYLPLYVFSKMNSKCISNKTFVAKHKPFLKGIFPTVQFSCVIVLLLCTYTIQRQISFAKNQHLGFSKHNLLQLNLPNNFNEQDVLKREMEALSFVESASRSYGSPALINYTYYDKELEDNENKIFCIGVDKDFLRTFDISLLSGHTFLSGELEKACYVNEAFLRTKNWSTPDDYMNQKIANFKIVGVVNDFCTESLHAPIQPTILFYSNTNLFLLNVRLSEGDLTNQLDQIKSVWNKILPGVFFNYTFYDEVFDSMYKREEKLGKAISLFSLVAIFITIMGLLGLVMQLSIARTKEIGIRKVNGAKTHEIIRMLNTDFLKWVAVAFVIACPIAWYAMHKWLQNFAYKTELSWWVFALAGLIATGITLLTVSVQSWRAATRNPVESLRYE